MRKNMQQVIGAFENHKAFGKGSISTDGDRIFSYGTVILERRTNGFAYNDTRYSVTTSHQQSVLRAMFLPFIVEYHSHVPMGTRSLQGV